MALKISFIFWASLLLCCLEETESTCSSSEIHCKSTTQCVALSNVCRGGQQCSDGSDEDPRICSFWTYDSSCGSGGTFHCSSSYGCKSIKDYCGSNFNCAGKDPRICQLVQSGILELTPEEAGIDLTEQMIDLLQQAVNASLSESEYFCPMFYTRVGDTCLSFFSPAKIPWAEARQFCLSIKGDLLSIKDWFNYEQLLEYMRFSELSTDFWIGGRYDLDVNAWSWVTDDSAMPLGSPYWATRYSSSCVPRSPPHTDPFNDPADALPGAPCYHYQQGPVKRTQGWCAAMTYEHYYYISDEICEDTRSPLCVYIRKSYAKKDNSTL